ncbi:uncharacterized protein [Apostichopus japonicus]|uniref:uncharacterized protein isoform X2 n=1 Tax=Stichopus japonicus TaxID=307972 RepID=UPI003AB55F21
MEKCFNVFLTVLTIWSSFGTEMIIFSAEGRSSGSLYFVFQQPVYPRDCKEVSNACSSTNNTSGVYLIKPDVYPEPFEAYCNNDLDTGGWTVLQRRRLDSINFNRSWKDFRNGFGFLGSEFWIGNEKIAVLTNQKRYQLRLDFENVAGETYYVTYDEFRISDEWGDYFISSLGSFARSNETIPEWCPANEIFSNETCERTCDDPDTCTSANSRTESEQCVCVGEYLKQQEQCIPLNQCNCFVADKTSVLGEGDFYVNARCTQRSTCRNNQIIEASYQCSDNATCAERNGVRKCYCNPNYQGDGVTCRHNCFVADIGIVLGEGHFYINSRCTRKSTCRNSRLVDESYQCSSHATCAERSGVRKCYCNSNYQGDGETCTHNCFVAEKGSVVGEGHFYINSRCTRKSTCRNSRLVDESYQCSSHATCALRSGVRKCYCNSNYQGDGETCTHNCFVAEKGSVLGEGHFYINSRCTRKSTCRNSRLVDESYQCSSHATCALRSGVRKCYCNSNYQGDGETCTHNCFVAEKGSVLGEGHFYINSRCTRKSTCRNSRLVDESYQCSSHATCALRSGVRKCYCNSNYQGDGETCTHNCFVAEKGSVLGEGHFYINSRCTRKSTCRNSRLVDESYQCSSHATCALRSGVRKCYCNSNYQGDGETCTHNCFVAEKGSVLGEGHFYINSRCTRKSTCRNSRLVDESYQCSSHATCALRSGVRKCYCNSNYEGDGVTCTRVLPKDCHELYVSGTRRDGVYTIYPDGWPSGIQVYCEMESNGGGWTVFQKRSSASADFYRGWLDYKNGFGNKNQDHWLGNKYIHSMTNQKTYQLRIDLRDSASSSFHAVYSTFSINNEADKYRLSVGSYSGNAGNRLSGSNNKQFSTKDRDYDGWSTFDCAERHRGAWWFYRYYHCTSSHCRSNCRTYDYYCYYFPDGSNKCAYCAYSHLNGDYDGSTRGTHMFWYSYSLNSYGCNLQYTDMKIRPV